MNILINGVPKSATLFITSVFTNHFCCDQTRIGTRGVVCSQVDVEALFTSLSRQHVVSQQHICPSDYNIKALKSCGLTKFVLTIRDPRDVIISWAHHMLRKDLAAWHHPLVVANGIVDMDYYNLAWEKQLDHLVDNAFKLFQAWIKGWVKAVNDSELEIYLLRYEDFALDNAGHIIKLMEFYKIDSWTLERVLPAIPEGNGSIHLSTHFRKGLAGTFREEFSPAQIDRINAQVDRNLFSQVGWPL